MSLAWDRLAKYLPEGVALSSEQIQALDRHWQLVEKWNRVVNLTRITKPEEALRRHYAESLYLGALLPSRRLVIVDVGSGAGFPGVPVAVLRPECRVILVEADQRKAVFLRQVREWVRNIEVRGARADTLSGPVDWAVARAVDFSQVIELATGWSANFAVLTSKGRLAALGEHGVEGFRLLVKPLPWDSSLCVVLGENVSRGTGSEASQRDFHLPASDAKIS